MPYDDMISTDPSDHPGDAAMLRAIETITDECNAARIRIMIEVHEHAHALEALGNELLKEFKSARRKACNEAERIYGEGATSEWMPEEWDLANDLLSKSEELSTLAVANGAQVTTEGYKQ